MTSTKTLVSQLAQKKVTDQAEIEAAKQQILAHINSLEDETQKNTTLALFKKDKYAELEQELYAKDPLAMTVTIIIAIIVVYVIVTMMLTH